MVINGAQDIPSSFNNADFIIYVEKLNLDEKIHMKESVSQIKADKCQIPQQCADVKSKPDQIHIVSPMYATATVTITVKI
jgi:hypothetical protein